ncbi:acyltransferase [Sphingomonas koreensis]|nr:acyltransferase [Sphingomonas koreensis]
MKGVRQPDSRIHWADTAKGLIILVIVAVHVAEHLEGAGYPQRFVRQALDSVTPIGMPFFFMVSGMFSRTYLDGSWRAFWRHRISILSWLLIVWTPIESALFAVIPSFTDPVHPFHLRQIARQLLFPTSYLWFIWSLVVYSLVAKVMGRRGWNAKLVIASAPTLFLLGFTVWHLHKYGIIWLADNFYARCVLTYFFFFYLGYVQRERILAITSLPVVATMVATLALFGLLFWVTLMPLSIIVGAAVRFAAIAIGIVAAIYTGKSLALDSRVRRLFFGLGALTLPIYLVHLVVLMPIAYWLHGQQSPVLLAMGGGLTLGLTVVCVLLSIGVMAVGARLGLTFVLFPPAFWVNLFGAEKIAPAPAELLEADRGAEPAPPQDPASITAAGG